MDIKLLCTLLFLLAFACYGFSQEELRYYNITDAQGLSQSVVNCICQDKQGFMWFGTQDGLNRYDGLKITVFQNDPVDSNSVISNNITCLYQGKRGILWIGTDEGLSALNTYTGKFTTYTHTASKNSLSGNYVHAIYQDTKGNLWISTNTYGLNKYNPSTKRFTPYFLSSNDSSADSSSSYISAITEDTNGNLWLGNLHSGLYLFNTRSNTFFTYSKHSANAHTAFPAILHITTLYIDRKLGQLFVGTLDNGMAIFSTRERKFVRLYPPKDSNYPNYIKKIAADAHGNLWIATKNGQGLVKFNIEENSFSDYAGVPGSSLSFNAKSYNTLCISPDGIIWAGTNNGVADYVPKKREFVNYADTTNPNATVIMAIARDAYGKLWLGTDGAGVACYNERTKTYTYNRLLNKAMNDSSAAALYIDKKSVLWVGTWESGIVGYNLLSKKIIALDSLNPAIAQTTVMAITQDHTGKLWIATYGSGVFIYDEARHTLHRLTATLSDERILCLYEDKEHTMWLGTDGGGLNCYAITTGKNTVIKKMRGTNTLSSNSVNCVYEDTRGDIWLGTDAGLNKYTPSTHNFVHYFRKDGLPDDYICCILPDKEGDLWLSTNKGISRFNPHIHNEEGSAFKNYDVSNGIGEDEFNQGAAYKAPDGRLFFGGVNGMTAFYPEKITGNVHKPAVYITTCRILGQSYKSDSLISQKKVLTLSWKENALSFSFVGLDYEMPAKNRYSYMLQGMDKKWSAPSTMHYASYAQLPPGKYIFRVRACNNDGLWNNTGACIYIHIIPPFWRTTWFYILCILLATASVFGFIKYRTRRIEKEKKILETKVEERTHELAQRTRELAEKNNDITASIQYAKRIQQATLPPIEEIKKHLPSTFIFYLPKDIVSGDFYWFGEKNGKVIIAAADCTGHGVPGALMSMIGHNLLNQIVLEQGITQPASILNQLNTRVQTVLKQGISSIDNSDGMDMALCCIDKSTQELHYAGAYRPLVMIRNNTLIKTNADKQPIGGTQTGVERAFKSHACKLEKGDAIYMFSDGYADQFGGPAAKKFMLKRFLDELTSMQNLPMEMQGAKLLHTLQNWKGSNQQVDDILVIGIRF